MDSLRWQVAKINRLKENFLKGSRHLSSSKSRNFVAKKTFLDDIIIKFDTLNQSEF